MRIIIELPRLNENHKSLANIVNKTWHCLHLQRQGHLNTGTLYRYNSKSYKFVAIILIGIIY
ncbi:TPA: hypothetical protein HMQ09_16165 [Escherichia coli]|nr:hypothetical protein [Escherichia coli]OYJ47228.1 hypothetical protein CI736_07780 [Shigella boydii]OYL28945.1 hypothetical protein CI769_19480 [Shigella sonnei]EFO0416148.1 hypothetical protein [Escherichia coli]EFO0700455.1 hypothetical protein [Escherichia coli]